MLNSFLVWAKGISVVGKVVGITATALIGGTVVSAIASPAPTPSAEPAEIVEIVEDVKEPLIEIKTVTEEISAAFDTQTVEDSKTKKGETYIKTVGVPGVKTITYEVTFQDGIEKSRKIVSEAITKEPVKEVIAVGTYVYVAPEPVAKPSSNCDPNYTPCVPNVSYDLDCPDIGFSVTVIGYDKHGFDGNDNDGNGCESY